MQDRFKFRSFDKQIKKNEIWGYSVRIGGL